MIHNGILVVVQYNSIRFRNMINGFFTLLAVSINGEVTNDGLRARVNASDEVHFVAAISGGA